MDNKEAFISQTAIDYDMDFATVAIIYIKYPDTFYLELEEYVKKTE